MDLLVIADTPTLTLDDGSDSATSEVQIAKTGTFRDPRYGKFSITRKDFSKWIDNFNKLSKSGDRAGLPVDVDHGPEKSGNTEAAGWITALHDRGDELWATVEWNTLGVELVGEKRYLYLSPSYQHNYSDEEGKTHGTALVGVALTNRPFLTMATVSLSKDWTFAQPVDAPVEREDSHEQMPLSDVAKLIGLSEDSDEATILSKIQELQAAAQKPPESVDLAALAAASGQVLLDQTKVTQLAADAAAGRKAAEELHNTKFLNAFNMAVEDGRMLPAQQESMRALYDLDAEKTLAAIAAAPKVLNTDLKGETGTRRPVTGDAVLAAAGNTPVDEDRQELHERAVALSQEKNIDYTDAVFLAAEELMG